MFGSFLTVTSKFGYHLFRGDGIRGKKKLVVCDLIPLNVELCGMHAFLSTISNKQKKKSKRYIQIIKRKRKKYIYTALRIRFHLCYAVVNI